MTCLPWIISKNLGLDGQNDHAKNRLIFKDKNADCDSDVFFISSVKCFFGTCRHRQKTKLTRWFWKHSGLCGLFHGVIENPMDAILTCNTALYLIKTEVWCKVNDAKCVVGVTAIDWGGKRERERERERDMKMEVEVQGQNKNLMWNFRIHAHAPRHPLSSTWHPSTAKC